MLLDAFHELSLPADRVEAVLDADLAEVSNGLAALQGRPWAGFLQNTTSCAQRMPHHRYRSSHRTYRKHGSHRTQKRAHRITMTNR